MGGLVARKSGHTEWHTFGACSQRTHTPIKIKLHRCINAFPTQNMLYEATEASLDIQRNKTRKRETQRVKRLPNSRTSSKSLQNRRKIQRATHHSFHARGTRNIRSLRGTRSRRRLASILGWLRVTGNTFFRETLGLFCRVYVQNAWMRRRP